MKTINYFNLLFLILLVPSLTICQSILVRDNINNPILNSNLISEKSLISNKFTMNQGFTLSTSMNNGMNESFGIYSNQSQFKISEKFKIKTDLNLIQGQNSFSKMPQGSIQYGIGMEYKINSNSIFTFQIINKGKHINRHNMIFPSKVHN